MLFNKPSVRKKFKSQKGLFAAENIRKGEIILDFPGRIVGEKEAGEWDLQIGKSRFIRAFRKNQADNFLNHSCSPNSFVKEIGRKFYLIALKEIQKGEEITFDYDATDYDNADFAFACRCGSKKCRKAIRGFKYLGKKEKKRIEKYLIHYLRKIHASKNVA